MLSTRVASVNVYELQKLFGGHEPPLLLDVRELDEWQLCRIQGARHIPMSQMQARYGELDTACETVVYCHHGIRSQSVAEFLVGKGFSKVASLTGGIDAWSALIDPTVPRYGPG